LLKITGSSLSPETLGKSAIDPGPACRSFVASEKERFRENAAVLKERLGTYF